MNLTDILLFGDAINGGGSVNFPLSITTPLGKFKVYCGPADKNNIFTYEGVELLRIGDYIEPAPKTAACLLFVNKAGEAEVAVSGDVAAGIYDISVGGNPVLVAVDDIYAKDLGLPSGGIYITASYVEVGTAWEFMVLAV